MSVFFKREESVFCMCYTCFDQACLTLAVHKSIIITILVMTPLSHNFRLDGEFEILVTSLNLYIKSFAFVYVPVHFFV